MIVNIETKNEWCITSLNDFIKQFKIEKDMLKYFNDIEDINNVYDSKEFVDDEKHIREWLEESNKKFMLEYYDDDNNEGYWLISEVEQ